MSDPQERDDINSAMFTDIQLLGFDVVAMEAAYKMSFHKDMFNLPNKVGAEVVVHFLFTRLNPASAAEQFRDCWPLLDKKAELQFRKVCTSWLASIQKEDAGYRLPRVNAALLLSPGGRKFIQLMYSFSTHVLVQVMISEHGWKSQDSIVYPVLQPRLAAFSSVMKSAVQDSVAREQTQFFEQLQITMMANKQWKDHTSELVKEYRNLTKTQRDLEQEKRQQVKIQAERCLRQGISMPVKHTVNMFDTDTDAASVNRAHRIDKLRSQWKLLSKFSEHMTEMRDVFQSILNNTAANYAIDGSELEIRVPALLLRECSREIQKHGIDNIYNGGALNLVSLIQLCNLCLSLYKQQLEKERIPSLASEVPLLDAKAHKHQSHWRHTHELREKINQHTMPRVKQLIVEKQMHLNYSSAHSPTVDTNSNRLGLILTAPTPPGGPVDVTNSIRVGATPTGPVAGNINVDDTTPDALQNVTRNIEEVVQGGLLPGQTRHTSFSALTSLKKQKQRAAFTSDSDVSMSSSHCSSNRGKSVRTALSNNRRPTKTSEPPVSSHRVMGKPPPPQEKTQVHSQVKTDKFAHFSQDRNHLSVSQLYQTPRNSRQKAMDILADSIVESVLNSPDSTLMSNMSTDSLLDLGDFDTEAFVTRNLIGRSPVGADEPSL